MKQLIAQGNKTIEINVFGDSDKVLFLLPGWTDDVSTAGEFIVELAKKHRVITIAYPGYGSSSESRLAQSMDYIATCVETVVAHLRLKRFVFLGFSLGCQVATHYMRRHKDQQAVLISPTLESLRNDVPWYGKALIDNSLLVGAARMLPFVEKFLVNKAYSSIRSVTEGRKSNAKFTPGYTTLHGAYDTLVALLSSFVDPVEFRKNVAFIFGEQEILQQRLDRLDIPYYLIRDDGHGGFSKHPVEIATLVHDAVSELG